MAKTVQLYEAIKAADGHYECLPVDTVGCDEQEPAHAPLQEPGQSGNEGAEQGYAFDPEGFSSKLPDWATEAHTVFLQSLYQNAQGGHSEYFLQVRARFERMRQALQQQMQRYTQPD